MKCLLRLLATLIAALCASPLLSSDCGGTTNLWLSPSSGSPLFADTPFVNSTSPTTLYIWAKLADGQTITDLSVMVESIELELSDVVLDNPEVGVGDRFETISSTGNDDSSLFEVNGYTLRGRDGGPKGIGPVTRDDDPLYDPMVDAWRLGSLVASGTEGSLFLQVGRNGIQGVDANGDETPLFSVVFGDVADEALCSIDDRGVSSNKPDAFVSSRTLAATELGVLTGSYVQGADAELRLTLGELPWSVPGPATVDGDLSITGELFVPPRGTTSSIDLMTTASLEGEFDRVLVGGLNVLIEPEPHVGTFHSLEYSTSSVSLTTYAALVGDADGDRHVAFSDFLILRENFGEAGDWMDGDFDGDGTVDFPDFLLLSGNFGTSLGAQLVPVPEPATGGLALLTVFALAVRYRPLRKRVTT